MSATYFKQPGARSAATRLATARTAIAIAIAIVATPLAAHHPGGGSVGSSTSLHHAGNAVGLTTTRQKNEPGSRHSSSVAPFLSFSLWHDRIGLYLSLPYIHYEQKGVANAARIGRASFGARTTLWRSEAWQLASTFEATVPSASSKSRFTNEPWSEIAPGLSIGRYAAGPYLYVGFSATLPASRLPAAQIDPYLYRFGLISGPERTTYRGLWCTIWFPCAGEMEQINRSSHRLRKVSNAVSHIGWSGDWWRLYASAMVRTPYSGTLVMVEPPLWSHIWPQLNEFELIAAELLAPELPRIYREAGLGVSIEYSRWMMTIEWARPMTKLNRMPLIDHYLHLRLTNRLIDEPRREQPYDERWLVMVAFAY